jgi:hypothetical protein
MVIGLNAGFAYTFSVVASNRAGSSPEAFVRGVVLFMPSVTINSGVAVASWRAPAFLDPSMAHYRLVLEPGHFECSTVEVTACAWNGAPSVAKYQVSLELLGPSDRVLSVATGLVHEVSLLRAYFATDSYHLSPAMKAKVVTLARELVKHRVSDVTIYGHADIAGRLGENVTLSHRRAQAVGTYLLLQLRNLGDRSVRIHVVGGGVSTASSLYSLDRNAIVVMAAP